jgi:hypothetical protein
MKTTVSKLIAMIGTIAASFVAATLDQAAQEKRIMESATRRPGRR